MKATLPRFAFKGIVRRTQSHKDGIPLYQAMSKQWIMRDGERWWQLDAKGKQLDYVAETAAHIVCGMHRPDFTPGVLGGDQLVILNTKEIVMTGDQWIRVPVTWQTKWANGNYRVRMSEMYDRDPSMVVFNAIREKVTFHFPRKLKTRCLPLENLWLYEDAVHPHHEMNPRPWEWREPEHYARWQSKLNVKRWKFNQYMT